MAKQSSRFTATYWMGHVYRPKYLRDGKYFEVGEWYARIQHGGSRDAIGLGTNNQEEAARKAAYLYQTIRSKGWAEAIREFSPARSNPLNRATVGGHIDAARSVLRVRHVSTHKYAYCLRRLAADIAGLNNDSKNKYDPLHKPWQETADKIKLSVLTPVSIEKWKVDYLNQAEANPVGQIAARRTVNYYVRNARSLFGKKVQRKFKELGLPEFKNPFEGVDLEKEGNTRYVSTINADELLKKAKEELDDEDPDAWKVILLALGAGLRRAEIDGLSVKQLDFTKSRIRVTIHEHFEAKNSESIGAVHVDISLLEELEKHIEPSSYFVVESQTPPATGPRAPGYYRCDRTFGRVTKWLRANGICEDRPIHVLRKEFGSIINAQSDIYTASTQLRHGSIMTTAAFYTDNRKRSTIPVGDILKSRKSKRGKHQ